MTYIKILIAVSGLALLTACGGGKVTISAEDIERLEAELSKTKNAQKDAETSRDAAEAARANAKAAQAEAERLRGLAEIAMNNAVSAQLKANKEITRLKNELATAITERNSARGDKEAADLRITELKGDLESLTRDKNAANLRIIELEGDLETLTRAKKLADAEVLRLTGELKTVTGAKESVESERDTANDKIEDLEDKLSTATTDKNTANDKIKALKDDIRLIEDARITFADWAGTAEALKTDVKNADDTGTEPLLNGVASVDDSNPALIFIQGLPTLAGQGFDFTGTAFADADVTGDVLLLVDNSPNGVAFSRVSGTGVTGEKFYAGLLPTTNLGAPITDISTDAIWDAKIMLVLIASPNLYSNLDFKMQVTFDGSGGTINSGTVSGGVFTAGQISVTYTVPDSATTDSNDFNIQGKFGSDGLLYGTVGIGSNTDGTLTGLIGVGGAVASFVGDSFAGGFVAYPTDPRIAELEGELSTANSDKEVADNKIKALKNDIRLIEDARITFIDWAGTAEALKPDVKNADNTGTEPLLNGVASVDDSNPATNFIQGLPTLAGKGFDFTGTPFSDATVTGDILLLVDNNPNGVAFSRVSGAGVTGEKFYTGLLPTTNLGAPITDISTNAIWEAKIMLLTSSNLYSNPDFKIRVIFDGSEGTINSGTVSGGVFTDGVVSLASNEDINIQGKFGSDGLLYGTVAYDSVTANGTLTGLIGVGGAVGAFVGDSFAGGFVAYPTDPRIAELEEEARLAGIAKEAADDKIDDLEGKLSTATTDKNTANDKIKALKDELRLIEDARITFIDWAGTAEALNPDVKNAEGTGTEPLLNGVASVGDNNPALSFIQGLPTLAGQGFDFTGTPFADADVTGDILLLVDNNPSGVAFSRVSGTGVTGEKFYTGLLPTTNLGAPITDISTNAIWDAKIMLLASPNLYSNLDFKMQVTFDGNGGTINSGTVLGGVFTDGVVSLASDSFNEDINIQGKFGSDGLLYGTVAYDSSTANGTLTGLIGVGGAVGAFVGDSFAGGFVAYPSGTDPRIAQLEGKLSTANSDKEAADNKIKTLKNDIRLIEEARITFIDWAGTAEALKPDVKNADDTGTEPLLNGVASVNDSNPATNFIQGLPTLAGQGFDFTGTAFVDADVTGDILLLVDNSPNGVAFSRVSGTGVTGEKFYTGLLPTTNLGAPITDISTNAIWDAKIMLLTSPNLYSNLDFKMQVTFDGNGGTINSGTVSEGVFTAGQISVSYTIPDSATTDSNDFNIQGKFGSDGLLYGTVAYDSVTANGTLTGLIGVGGAVASFVGDSFAGGFVVYPTDPRIAELEEEARLAGIAKEAADNKIKALKDDIDLIEDARITSADWGGTAEEPNTTVIDSAGTGTEPLLNGPASVVNIGPPTNFIQGLPTLAGQGFDFTGTSFSDADVYGDVLLLNEGGSSGVAFSGVTFSQVLGAGVRNRKFYAGLLPTTNLGAPITDISTNAIWEAQFGAVLGGFCCNTQKYSHLGFKMQVIFDGNGGTISSGTVLGRVFTKGSVTVPYTNLSSPGVDGSDDFNIEGKFGNDGLLYGTVNLSTNIESTLTGLIGVRGAVGAFVGIGLRGTNIAGGFVAYPTDPRIAGLKEEARLARIAKEAADNKVKELTEELENANTEVTRLTQFIRPTYANWKLAVNPETVPNITTPQNQFLQADEDSISTEGTSAVPNNVQTLDLSNATFDGLSLGGEAAYGVAFFNAMIDRVSYNYAGVFSGTDLGAPITDRAGTTAIWYGSFNHTLNPSKDFALTVTFNKIGGTLDAFVRAGVANDSFIFDDVRFDTRGLITGEVLYISFSQNGRTAITRTKTATLRGLIGEAGAVGVFVGEKGSNSNIGGGFVAHPTATLDSNKINFADWGGVDGDPKPDVPNADNTPLLYGVASVGNSNPAGNFIHGLAISPVNEGFHFVGTPFASATVTGDVLYMGEDGTSGAAFSRVRGAGVTGVKYYAGLLPTTDLGVPITAKDLSVTWDAKFTLNSNGGAFVNSSFKIRVRFNGNGGTINSGTPAGNGFTNGGVRLSSSSSSTITIQGKFGRDGVLYGTVGNGTLTGLIGVNGAVGAFVGATLAGGFVAYPNAARTINAADWGGTAGDPKTTVINKDNTGTDPLLNGFESVVNIGPTGNFIQGLPTVAGKGFKFAGTAFSDEDVYGDVLLLDEGSSSGVAFSHVLGTGVTDRKYYAGLLSSTNLGAPITDITTDAIWNAQFRAVLGGLRSDIQEYSHLGFKMRVIFNGVGHSTINSGTVSNGVFTKGSVTVPYTNITSPGFDGSGDFSIQGKFTNGGLLYGKVNLGEKTEATLTGLVGVSGAVGAFVSIKPGRLGVNIVGGFVAHPIDKVNFTDWAGFSGNMKTGVINKDNTGTEPLLYGAASVVDSGPRVNFIQRLRKSDGQGFNFAGTAFPSATVYGNVLYLDESRPNGSGIAFSQVSGVGVTDRRYYAGLLSTTNLGSRITDPNTSAIWDAKLKGMYGLGIFTPPVLYSNLNFKMQVIFDGNKGTINSGTVSGDSFTSGEISTDGFGDFNIQGKFGRDGLLYGTVGINSDTNGTLTGLIGVDGAVGVFAFDATGVISYVGGFVAAPPQ